MSPSVLGPRNIFCDGDGPKCLAVWASNLTEIRMLSRRRLLPAPGKVLCRKTGDLCCPNSCCAPGSNECDAAGDCQIVASNS
jgi:hypothetical protein